jgi:nitrite reductase/ring-hydroxylating ferredoxin subunit
MARHALAPVDEVPPGTSRSFTVEGRAVAVYNVAGQFYALRDSCPHQGAALSGGTVAGALRASQPGCYDFDPNHRLVRCPWHGWEYDLATGQSYYSPRRKVRSYPVSVEPGAELTAAEGPYVAETFPISVQDDYVVIEL